MGQGCWRIARSALSGSCVFVALVVVACLSATFNAASVCVLAFLIPRTTYYKVDATPTSATATRQIESRLASEIVWQVLNYCVIDKLEHCVIEAMYKTKVNLKTPKKNKSIRCRNCN